MAIQYEQLSFVFEPPEDDVDWTEEDVEQLQIYVLNNGVRPTSNIRHQHGP